MRLLILFKSAMFVFILAMGYAPASVLAMPSNTDSRSSLDHHGSRNDFSAVGIIFCAEAGNRVNGECSLKFFRLSNLKIYDVEPSQDLVNAHFENHSDLKVSVAGRYTVRSIFRNDRFKVAKFDIIASAEPNWQALYEDRNRRSLENQRHLGFLNRP